MAGVTKPLACGAANKVRRLKNKKAAHTVRPAPTPGPLTLTLTFPIHFGSRIKRLLCLRTSPIHSPVSAPSENLLSNIGAAPRPCRLRPVPAEREKNRPVASAGALV